MKHDGRLCECGKPVKVNLTSGRNKGYYRTCGDAECAARGIRSERAKAARAAALVPRKCTNCSEEYIPTSSCQKWCQICVPDGPSRARMRRYGISAPEFEAMKAQNDGLCPLCNKRPATVLDHNHTTKENRGALCNRCNVILSEIEDAEWLKRAVKYAVRKPSAAEIFPRKQRQVRKARC